MTGQHVAGVHAARALAVTLVLAAHMVGLWTNSETFRWWPWQAYLGLIIDPLRIDHQAGGHVGLLLFFLVSGYIVSQAADGETRRAFAIKRAARLLPAMALAVLLTLLVATLGRSLDWPPMPGFSPDRAYSAWTLAESVGLGLFFGGNAVLFVLWSINVEYWWYLLLGLFAGLAKRRPVGATLLITVVTAAATLPPTDPGVGPLQLGRNVLTYTFVILIGRWIYLRRSRGVSRLAATVGITATFLLYVGARWRFDGSELLRGGHPRALSVLWATGIFYLLLRLVKSGPWRPVAFVGDISYGLYLFHIPVMWLVLPVVSPGGRWFLLGLTLAVGLTVSLAWASYRIVETPVRRLVRRYLSPPSPTLRAKSTVSAHRETDTSAEDAASPHRSN